MKIEYTIKIKNKMLIGEEEKKVKVVQRKMSGKGGGRGNINNEIQRHGWTNATLPVEMRSDEIRGSTLK